jgi:hypothetical protein
MKSKTATPSGKYVISRRDLLNQGILTGLSLAAGLVISRTSNKSNEANIGFKEINTENTNRKQIKSSGETFVDNFDC